jgi:predicted DNA-binding transcriptional regulator AlpA
VRDASQADWNLKMKLLKSAEVSAKVRVPEETLRYWRWRSEGPRSFKVGKAVVYDEADVDAWLAEQRAKSLRGGDTAPSSGGRGAA